MGENLNFNSLNGTRYPPSPSVTDRYVFFSSLQHERFNPSLYEQARTTLSGIVDNMFSKGEDAEQKEEKTFFNKMTNIITFVEKAKNNAKKAETAYFNQLATNLKGEKNLITEALNNTDDYTNFINVMNQLLRNKDQYSVILEQQKEDLKNIQEAYESFSIRNNIGENIKRHEVEKQVVLHERVKKTNSNYALYNELEKKLGEAQAKNTSKKIAEAISKAIKTLANDTHLINKVKDMLDSQIKGKAPDDTKIKEAILTLIAEKGLNLFQTGLSGVENLQVTIDEIVNIINNGLELEDSTNFLTETKKLKIYTDENGLLTKGDNLFELYSRLKKKNSEDKLLKLIGVDLSEDDEILDKNQKKLKEEILKLNNFIESPESNSVNSARTKQNYSRILKREINKALTRGDKQINSKNFREIVNQSVVLKIDPCDVSELLDALPAALGRALGVKSTTSIGGRKQNLKDDVRIHVSFDTSLSPTAIEIINTIKEGTLVKPIQKLYERTNEEQKKNFQKKEKTSQVKKIIDSYSIAAEETEDALQKLIQNKKATIDEIEQIVQAIDSYVVSISVKNYSEYNNKYGYMGGSLGSDINAAVTNIIEMYNLGGISDLDKNKVIWAIINCSKSGVIADKKVAIADFLVGGAALYMFDTAFADIDMFENDLKTRYKESFGTTFVHIYSLNNIYVPESYILSLIHDRLKLVYKDISSNYKIRSTKNSRSGGYINIYNPISPADINISLEPEKRWREISDKAYSETKISFLFMAGMLDLMEELSTLGKI